MTKDEALRLALEAFEYIEHNYMSLPAPATKAITAIKAALEANDEPVGLIESLKDAQPCCGQYETCWRACTPRGKFIGQRDAQRKPLTDEEIYLCTNHIDRNARGWANEFARAIEAAHGIKGEA